MSNFKFWLLLNENIEENFDEWLELLYKYTKKGTEAESILRSYARGFSKLIGEDPESWQDSEKEQLKNIIEPIKKEYIKQCLKEKNLENFNWFSFSIGYLIAKPDFLLEDIELAIDVTKRRIDSRDLLKTEIGHKGWLVIGYESLEKTNDYLAQQQELSNRQLEKMRKKGESLSKEDEKYIRLLFEEGDIKIYFLPAIVNDEKNLKARHVILCKYGKGAKWCTANPTGSYHSYYSNNNIYIIYKNNLAVYQFIDCRDKDNHLQFMDINNISAKEVEGDIYDILNTNFIDKINCYNIKRMYSLEDFLSLSEEEKTKALSKISSNNIVKLIDQSNQDQTFLILRNLIKNKKLIYVDLSSSFRAHSQAEPLEAFIKKIGVDKLIDEIGYKINNAIFSNIILSQISSNSLYNNIKHMLSYNPNLIEESKFEWMLDRIILNIRKNSKENIREIISMFANKLSTNQIQQIIVNDFELMFPILEAKTSKIDTETVRIMLKYLHLYAQGFNSISLSPIVKRTGIPIKSAIKSKEMKFIDLILSKDISTSAIKLILSGSYLNAKSLSERIEKIKQIAQVIGEERITKIKNNEIPDVIKMSVEALGTPDSEKLTTVRPLDRGRGPARINRRLLVKTNEKNTPIIVSKSNKSKEELDKNKEELSQELFNIFKIYHRKFTN
jgi:hypothetical protein